MQKIGGTILTLGYVRYIKILTLPRGIRVKIAFFFTTPSSRNSQKRSTNEILKMTRKSRSHVRILIYRTWAYVQSGKWSFKTLFKIFAVR